MLRLQRLPACWSGWGGGREGKGAGWERGGRATLSLGRASNLVFRRNHSSKTRPATGIKCVLDYHSSHESPRKRWRNSARLETQSALLGYGTPLDSAVAVVRNFACVPRSLFSEILRVQVRYTGVFCRSPRIAHCLFGHMHPVPPTVREAEGVETTFFRRPGSLTGRRRGNVCGRLVENSASEIAHDCGSRSEYV